jgi:hypothetical protein
MIHYDETIKNPVYSNEQFRELKGYLDEKTAKISLAKFLYSNLGLTVRMFTGGDVQLFPYQEVLLRSWFDHNFIMSVLSRGGAKSTLCAIFCAFYPIFHPNAKIVLVANSFKNTRRIIKNVEKIINSKNATLLRQCFSAKTGKLEFVKRADEMVMDCPNGGTIVALPLSSQNRGVRADVLFLDEMLQIPEDMYEFVLKPFLTAKNNIKEQLQIKEAEDVLIAQGKMTEEERTILPSDKKIIGLTSASYDFEFVYKLYTQWVEKILNPERIIEDEKSFQEDKLKKSYFVCRMSYKALPKELVETEMIQEAKSSGGENSASFLREYCSIFSSSSDGYFNIRRLHENTVHPGELPCVQLKGNKDSKYILGIDPNFSASNTSDLFGMGLYLLNDDERTITLVHSYGVPGGRLQDHIKYLFYLLAHFNIVFIIADLSGEGEGFNFIETCNQSAFFTERGYKLGFVAGDFNNDENYMEEVRIAKNSYNLLNRKIVYRQAYQKQGWIRKANEYLQSMIDKNKVKFASKLFSHSSMLERAEKDIYPILFDGLTDKDSKLANSIYDWIAEVDQYQDDTKAQLALIEVKTTSTGTMQFTLPQHLARSKSPDRARKDLYSCMVLAAWGAKCYWDMTYEVNIKPKQSLAMPKMFVIPRN